MLLEIVGDGHDPAARPRLTSEDISFLGGFEFDGSLAAPEIDASVVRTPAQKAKIRAEQRAILERDLVDRREIASRAVSPVDSIVPADASPGKDDLISRLDDPAKFMELMDPGPDTGDTPWSKRNYSALASEGRRREQGRRPRSSGWQRLSTGGLNLSALPPGKRSSLPEAKSPPRTPCLLGPRRRMPSRKKAEQDHAAK